MQSFFACFSKNYWLAWDRFSLFTNLYTYYNASIHLLFYSIKITSIIQSFYEILIRIFTSIRESLLRNIRKPIAPKNSALQLWDCTLPDQLIESLLHFKSSHKATLRWHSIRIRLILHSCVRIVFSQITYRWHESWRRLKRWLQIKMITNKINGSTFFSHFLSHFILFFLLFFFFSIFFSVNFII